jgi:iron complex outermembrane recepter protein
MHLPAPYTRTTLSLTLLALLSATNAVGQETARQNQLEEVSVTAQRVERNMQTTPIAMTVMNAEALRNRRVQSIIDLADGAIPSLRVAPFFSRSSAITVGIRGIVPFDANQPSRDAGVGIYIDGVYLGRSQGLGAALFDIERIEVLKGPQGTLFGRNSTGGAVSIVTKKPTGEFGLRQTVGYRNFDGYSSETHLDLDRIGDFSIKLDGILTKRDGTVRNTLPGERDYNAYDRKGLHARVLWEPSDSFNADYSYDISLDYTTPFYLQVLALSPTALPLAPLMKVQPDRATETAIGVPLRWSQGKTEGHRLNLEWDLGSGLELRSISSYRELDQDQWDNAGPVLGVFRPNANFARYSIADMYQSQYSQEFQLVGSYDRWDFVSGLFYYHEAGGDWAWSPNTMRWNATGTEATPLPSLVAGQASAFPDRQSTAKLDSLAVFGQTTWNPDAFNQMLKLTFGLRYTEDDKSGDLTKVNGRDTLHRFAQDESRVDPLFIAALDPLDTLHLYAKWGTAYRAGGANSRSVTYRAFGPEEVATSELGLKYDFWDRRARLNVAAYQTRYTDIQIDFNALGLDAAAPNRTTIETVNAAGRGDIEGFEIDVSVLPLPDLTLSASYAYTDGTLPRAVNPFLNRSEQLNIIFTPQNAYSAAMDYNIDLGIGSGLVHLDVNSSDGYYALSNEATKTDRSLLVNARLAWRDIPLSGGTMLDLSLWSRNLADRQQTFLRSVALSALVGPYGIYNDPRTWGFDATFKF